MSQDNGRTEDARAAWSAVAPGWERNADLVARTGAPVQRWLVDHVDPRPGQTILELGAGPGDTGFAIATKLGDEGLLISSDVSPEMSDAAKRRAERFRVTKVKFSVIDDQDIGMVGGGVDGVVHRFGPMLLPDPAASIAGVRRVLRDGGRYVAAVWAGPEHNPWIVAMGLALISNGVELPGGGPTEPGGIFSLAEPEALRALLTEGGFDEVKIEPLHLPFDYASFDELWIQPSELAGPLSVVVDGLSNELVAAVKESFREFVEPYRSGIEYHPPARALCAVAR
jgi:ubiquinone/menaquinone biosynthesis C-methylase UbiE